MKLPLAALLILTAMPVRAHRLDEYLQATLLSVEKSRLEAQMTLTPGVAVFPQLIALIDTNADGVISEQEQRSYAGLVLQDISLGIDGHRLTPHLIATRFPTMDEMKEGRGEIHLDFDAELPRAGHNRKLTFENHHQSRIAAYQVNCLVPRDKNIRIVAQERDYWQSLYRLDYVQTDSGFDLRPVALWSGGFGWLGMIWLSMFKRNGLCWDGEERSMLNQ